MGPGSISLFNDGQICVLNAIANAVMPGVRIDGRGGEPIAQLASDHLFFADVARRTGKMFVTFAIRRFLKSMGALVVAVASSVVAAQLLDGGQTAHHALKIPNLIDHHSI